MNFAAKTFTGHQTQAIIRFTHHLFFSTDTPSLKNLAPLRKSEEYFRLTSPGKRTKLSAENKYPVSQLIIRENTL